MARQVPELQIVLTLLPLVELLSILGLLADLLKVIGVRDLVALGYFIPGGASQRGGGQAPMFQCRTLSDPAKIPNQKFGISTTGPSAEIPDLADGSALMRECHCFRG